MTKRPIIDADDVLPRLREIAAGAGGDVRLARDTIEAIELLQNNLLGRDMFIGARGLWDDFVAQLPRENTVDGEPVENADAHPLLQMGEDLRPTVLKKRS